MATVVESEFTVTGDSEAVAYSERRAISVSITITPPILPPGYCPSSWQDLVNNAFAFELNLPAGYTQIIVSDTTPIPEDRDKIWFKIDADGRIIGIYSWSSTFSDWLEYRPKELFAAVNDLTATANSDVLTTTNGTSPLVANQWFYWKHAVTNTGAISATINGSAGIPVVKPDGSNFAAGEVPNDWALFAFYDGVKLRVISPTMFVLPPVPPVTPPNIVSPLLPFPAAPLIIAAGATGWDPDVTWAHGLPAAPGRAFASLVCYAAISSGTIDGLFLGFTSPPQWASAINDTVPVEDVYYVADTTDQFENSGPRSIFIWWDATNIYLKYNGDDNGAPSVGEWNSNFAGAGKFVGKPLTFMNAHWKVQFTALPQV
jgi:hypothetical protein